MINITYKEYINGDRHGERENRVDRETTGLYVFEVTKMFSVLNREHFGNLKTEYERRPRRTEYEISK